MIAYNKTKLLNRRILEKAKHWYAQRLLSTGQFATITERYPVDFYSPNLFVKIGLFLFTWISLIAAVGLAAIVMMPAFEHATSGLISFLCAMVALGCVMLLEMLIKQRRLHRSGIDEALLYGALFFTGCAIGVCINDWFANTSDAVLLFCALSIPLLVAAAIRYADTLTSALLFACFYTICFLLLLKLGEVAKLVVPFAFMLLSAMMYTGVKRADKIEDWWYWKTVITVFECGSLLLFYLSGNYYVIREASVAFFHLSLSKGGDIPLAFFFYAFTAVVPLVYVFYGLKRKDRILFWIGLLTITASAVTFKYYFSLGHPEILLTIAGAALIGVAYIAIRYLRTPKHGLTFEEDPDENHFLQTNAEAILQAHSFQHSGPAAQRTEFGGGSGGGGGAAGEW